MFLFSWCSWSRWDGALGSVASAFMQTWWLALMSHKHLPINACHAYTISGVPVYTKI
jgi:uncharacterized membrane protein YccF (DUF307 family)